MRSATVCRTLVLLAVTSHGLLAVLSNDVDDAENERELRAALEAIENIFRNANKDGEDVTVSSKSNQNPHITEDLPATNSANTKYTVSGSDKTQIIQQKLKNEGEEVTASSPPEKVKTTQGKIVTQNTPTSTASRGRDETDDFIADINKRLAYIKLYEKLATYLQNQDLDDGKRKELEKKLAFVQSQMSDDDDDEDSQDGDDGDGQGQDDRDKMTDTVSPRGFRSRYRTRSRFRTRVRYGRTRVRVRAGYHRPVYPYPYQRPYPGHYPAQYSRTRYCYSSYNQTQVCVYSGSQRSYRRFLLYAVTALVIYLGAYLVKL